MTTKTKADDAPERTYDDGYDDAIQMVELIRNRAECLELAVKVHQGALIVDMVTNARAIVAAAQIFADFVIGKPEANQ